ncbi:MAG: peptidase S9 prolyl oligopeptidase active site protein [uncultured bacterium]|nr:MAG: peptidase S9 prolyl oligopeptidase active site protein [uncultured bacterium]
MKKIIYPIIIILGISALFLTLFLKKEVDQAAPSATEKSTEQKSSQSEKSALTKDSIPTMAEKEFQGSDLKLVKVLSKNETYTRYSITYMSEGFKISGIMNVPVGEGPFPVLILNHGYIEPENYTNGQGLKREQDFFARNGYVVLHSDYRNYGLSDFDPENDVRPRSGYVEDVLNAISAVKKSSFNFVDKENIGMLGHSMGGGITLNVMVTKPEIAKAYVLLAPIHSDYKVNFDKWVVPDTEFSGIAEKFYQQYGTYEENPEFWKSISAINYFDKIKSPIMLHQGTADDQVPVKWSRDLAKNLEKQGKDITYYEYPGEPHAFANAQSQVMQRTLEFFDKTLKNKE